MATSIPIAVRSSNGISVNLGPPNFGTVSEFTPVLSKSCRTVLFSPDGNYLAYVNGLVLKIVRTDVWKDVAVIEGTKAYHLAFSPKGTYLMSWEVFIVNKDHPQGSPNLHIYKTETGEHVKSFVHKKQTNWEPQWSVDEHLCARLVNTDVIFYEDSNFERIVNRINSSKIASYSLSPTAGTYHVLCQTIGGQGQPSIGKMFKYPLFDTQQALASKSFFQADKVEFYWNPKGTCALLLTITEVDKTGGSYYGKQGLHFLGNSGQTTMVTMSKDGPIYNVAWSPKAQEFCVIYGFTPAKATLFNLKCEPVFELGTGARNCIYYNPQGNMLLLGGFGNLRGQVEIWDTNNKKLIGKCEASDTTYLEWSPDGTHFLTATTAPRLRIDNGYKIWHYSGTLLFEKGVEQNEELYETCWKKFPKGHFKDPIISNEKIEGITSRQPQASKQVYRPPSARNRVINFKLHDDEEEPHKPGGDNNAPSKTALKQKKKREARKARKAEEGGDDGIVPSTPTLYVPRRSDGFGEAVSSPHVPTSGRFTFNESVPPSNASNEVIPEQTLEMPIDDNGTGRSVPSTPLQASPQEAGPSGEEQPGHKMHTDGEIPSITVSGVGDDSEQAPEGSGGECMGPPSVAGTSSETGQQEQQREEMLEGEDGVSSEGEKPLTAEEGEEEGREAEASPSTNTRSKSMTRGVPVARRSMRHATHSRGGVSRPSPTPIVWGGDQRGMRQEQPQRGRANFSPRATRRSRGRNQRPYGGGRF